MDTIDSESIYPFLERVILAIILWTVHQFVFADSFENKHVVLTMLGTSGGPQLNAERANPSTLLNIGNNYYLIDSGIGTARRLTEAGISIDKIKAIFITHQHPDHTMGLADLLADRKFVSGQKIELPPLEIYGPSGTVALANAAGEYVETGFAVFKTQGVGIGRIKPIFTGLDVQPGEIYNDEFITIMAHDNTHYVLMDGDDRNLNPSFSYLIETAHGSIVFSGDTGPDEGLADFGRNADLLVTEIVHLEKNIEVLTTQQELFGFPDNFIQAMVDHMTYQHLPGEDVGKLAYEMNTGTVILHHFGPVEIIPEIIEGNLKDISENYSGHVFAAKDLDQFCLMKSDKGHASVTLCNR